LGAKSGGAPTAVAEKLKLPARQTATATTPVVKFPACLDIGFSSATRSEAFFDDVALSMMALGSLLQRKHEQHRLVTHLAQFGGQGEPRRDISRERRRDGEQHGA
jgi:hypothetical protein